ncbi:S-layer homology domain-containing protein [Tolypothrix bouteillei VB521301_2]|uniref:S-layer homology domain-containing protein n=1 Tax=Tolypothrix bouteillei TaxID=1246981 RepID=UPI00056E2F63
MFNLSYWSLASAGLLLTGLVTTAVVPFVTLVSKVAMLQSSRYANAAPEPTANFPDTADHWAQPFIEALAERNIVTGYLDGTYRPNRPVNRDEFAAVLRQAFNQNQERRIASGSVYKDVPAGYWAAPAIEEAYEAGFMHGYPGGYFKPQQPVSRVEALVSLTQNLNLKESTPQATTQPAKSQRATKLFFFPLAMTSLMQPMVVAKAAKSVPQPPASVVVSNYYADAEKIPQYAVDNVAEATRAALVVNYPNTRILNPNKNATRGDIAAFVHQALVNQGRLEPLQSTRPASNYIVGRSIDR